MRYIYILSMAVLPIWSCSCARQASGQQAERRNPVQTLKKESEALDEALLLLEARDEDSRWLLRLAMDELGIEVKRVQALKQYVEFEFGSQRTEEQDILYRLSQLLGGDLSQVEREIARMKELAARSPGSVAAETLERRKESALMLRTHLSTLEREELNLDLLFPAKESSIKALEAFENFLLARKAAYEAETKLLALSRAALEAAVSRTQVELKLAEAWGDSVKTQLSSVQNALSEQLRQEAACVLSVLGTIGMHRRADSFGLLVEERFLEASIGYWEYTLAATELHMQKLETRSKLVEQRRVYSEGRLSRREDLLKKGAVQLEEVERSRREVDHLQQADERSMSDRRTLGLFREYIELALKVDKASVALCKERRKYAEQREKVIADSIQRVRTLSQAEVSLQSEEPFQASADCLERWHSSYCREFARLGVSVRGKSIGELFQHVHAELAGAAGPTRAEFYPLRTAWRHSFNDASAIALRGPERAPRSVLVPRAREMEIFRAAASKRAD